MPDNKFVVSKGVKILLLRGLDKMALPLLDKHLRDFGDDINELRMVADILLKRSLYEQALRYYNQALKLKPGDLDLQLGSILCLGSTGSKKQALEAMDALESGNNNNTKVLTDGVYTLVLIGEREKGLAYLNHLKQIAPSDPKVLQLWGLAMEQSGDSLKALALYERSFNGNPDDFTTARYLGDLLMQMKLWEKAEEHFRISLQHFPNEPYMLEKMGNLLVLCPDSKLLNPEEGREYSERAFIHKSSPPMTVISAGRSLSKAYALLGEKEKAYKYMNITINLARREKAPPQVLENLGKELESYR
jgi:tetratricopeptide (TPR) repeat protein